jgi:mevalonate pyrophosphate decarboxylase
MDAGPNVHVILPNKHVAQLLDWAKKTFPQIPCLIDQMGTGAKLLVTESKT